ncbi:MAG TPA: cytochrome P450 [Deltaproteobacteria bacterium]|jgi:cytochrome P450|nr:cytochrome P450 [Deltaproteobacteria bacterium]
MGEHEVHETGSHFAPDLPEFYLGNPHASFRRLRREDPLPWYPGSGGMWCVLKHADIVTVSRDPDRFTSTRGVQIGIRDLARPGGVPPTIIEMDPPEHNRYRKLVIQAFAPRATANLETMARQIARESLEAIHPGTVADLVEGLAVPIPMYMIAELLGVPRRDRSHFKRWSDAMIEAGGGGRSPATDAALGEMLGYFQTVLGERRRAPKDDLISTLASARIEGSVLSDPEILMFCATLLAAGNETTRNLISGGSLLLMQNPDEKRRLLAQRSLLPNAVEEMLRVWTPVHSFTRTATRETELRGGKISDGETLLLLYASANRDEEVWGEDSDRFDVGRDHSHQRHLAFGFGEHLCLGASLARLEALILFQELLARYPNFELAGEPTLLRSRLMHGVEHLPVLFRG